MPIDFPPGDEEDDGGEVAEESEQGFEGVDAVDIAEADGGEAGEHEDADACAEVSGVDGDAGLEGEAEGFGSVWFGDFAAAADPAADGAVEDEECGGEEEEPWDDGVEEFFREDEEEEPAGDAAEEADDAEREDPLFHFGEGFAEGPDASGHADEECDGGGGVCHDAGESGGHEGGEREHGSAAGDGVHDRGEEARGEDDPFFGSRHGGRMAGSGAGWKRDLPGGFQRPGLGGLTGGCQGWRPLKRVLRLRTEFPAVT